MGVRGERGVEVDGVGEVEVALDVDGPGGADLVEVDVEVAGVGGRLAVGFGAVGVEPGDGFGDESVELGGADLVGHRCDMGVDELRRGRCEAQGAFGDELQPPGLQLAAFEAGPAAAQPVAALHHVGEVAAPGLGGAAQGGGELDDGELRDLGAALATQRQRGLVPGVGRSDQGSGRVHRRPLRGGPHDPSSVVVLGTLRGPRGREHARGRRLR